MSNISIPVNPLLDANGGFASLKNFSDLPIKPNPFEGVDAARNEFGNEYKLNNSVSSKLEVAAIGGIEAQFGTTTFVHDSIIYRLSRGAIQGGSNLVKGTWWGYGIRVKIVIKNVQFGVKAGWSGIAAAVQLGYADAEFEIESIGITDSALFGLLPEPTDLNVSTFDEILDVGNKFRAAAHTADPTGVIYKPLRILVEPSMIGVDPLADDRHLIFTYQKISERTRLKDARENARELNLNPDVVSKMYKDVFQISDLNEKPSGDNKEIAKNWLKI
jgi:hypothetical protein